MRVRLCVMLVALSLGCAVSEPEPSGPCQDDGDCVAAEHCVDRICTRSQGSGAGCVDEDEDGFGVGPTAECGACLSRDECDEDCDDTSAERHPGAFDGCDGLDNDCDGETDEPQPCTTAADCAAAAPLLASCIGDACVYLPPNQEPAGCDAPVACFDGSRTASPACL